MTAAFFSVLFKQVQCGWVRQQGKIKLKYLQVFSVEGSYFRAFLCISKSKIVSSYFVRNYSLV